MKDQDLLNFITKQHGVSLYNEKGEIKNAFIFLDDLFLNCSTNEIVDILREIVVNYDDIFGGLTDERTR